MHDGAGQGRVVGVEDQCLPVLSHQHHPPARHQHPAGLGQRRDILRHEAETLRSRIAAARDSPTLVECALGCEHDDLTRCPHDRRQVVPDGRGHAVPGAG
ncbi:hypothetical protein ACFRNT_16955 [Streptomyces sp. NPDC056697]|uniref:hypothetical protein n=1 Tax=Streptomyces sp. NPDC056697 TaxID=3345915 RepID=UPI003698E4C1